MIDVMRSSARGIDRHRFVGRAADELALGRVGVGDPRRADRAGRR